MAKPIKTEIETTETAAEIDERWRKSLLAKGRHRYFCPVCEWAQYTPVAVDRCTRAQCPSNTANATEANND